MARRDFKHNSDIGEDGFSLIEVLAAMVIFTVAILGLSHAGTESVRGAGAIEAKTLGSIVADNQLTLARYRRIEIGTERGETEQLGREFEWELETQETGVEGFFQLIIQVQNPIDETVYVRRVAFVRDEGRL
ncbi:MAG: type II secretion system minor pseudopilin GspI [Maricaulaceae bacterium]